MGDRIEQNHSGPGDNVAGDQDITVQPEVQQGNVFNDRSQGHFYGPVNQYFGPPPIEPTIAGPPNNLTTYGLSPDRFVGRDRDLARLHGLLQTQTQVAIAGVSGLGGVGKSELALQYARAHLGDYPGGVVWLRAAAACGELVAFAQPRWFAQVDFTPLDTLEKQAAFCQAHWPNTAQNPPGRVLLILDDVTDFAGQVQGFPVVGDRFRVLLTSREKYLPPEARLDLEVLEPAAALALLSNLVGEARIAAERATAEKLCEWLGYLPLGLELVGNLLRLEPDWSIQSVLGRLKGEKLQHEAMDKIEIAFNISWQQLAPVPQQLAVLLGCFGNGPIPWELVEASVARCETQPRRQRKRDRLWRWITQKPAAQPEQWCLLLNRDRLTQARRRLVELSLLERTGENQYGLHPLIREFFAAQRADWPEGEALQQAFLGQMVSVAKTVPYGVTLADLERTRPAWPHLEAAATNSAKIADATDSTWPFIALARLAAGQGLWSEAEQHYSNCLTTTEHRFGPDHPATASSLNNLALLYKSQGRYEAAEPLYRRSLEIDEKVYGPDHPEVATDLNNLAGLYLSQGRCEAAEPLYRRSLEIRERLLGADHPHTAASLNNLAGLYYSQGRYEAAEPLYRRSLEIIEQVLGADHPDTAASLNNLANLYYSQGRYEAAEPLRLRCLAIEEKVFPENHPQIAASLNNLAALYESQGRYEAAEPLYRRSLEIWEQVLGADHPHTAISQGNLGQLYMAMERYSEAENLLLLALNTFQNALNSDHPYVQETIRRLNVLVQTVIEADRAADLSDHPLTQSLLQQLTPPPKP